MENDRTFCEKEMTSIMMTPFSQEKAVEQFGLAVSVLLAASPYKQDRHRGSFGSLFLCSRADGAFLPWIFCG